MGKACLNEMDRVLASRCGISSRPVFGSHLDLGYGGLLLSLPSLLACGLLHHAEQFASVSGYYTEEQVLVSLAFLVLLRVKKLEQSEGVIAGELGRCMGLDRIPCVKTLRERIAAFCAVSDVEKWSAELSREWMSADEDLEGALYVDGHVNLYYGHQTQMPKRFVSRMRLCLSGSTDYWVNDQLGQPFFVVHKTISEGLIKVLKEDIIPRLDKDVPNQPSREELAADSRLHCYMLVFDREGYSVDLFKELSEKRIAFCTYRKNVKEDWSEEDFTPYEIVSPNGEKEQILLAERQTVLRGKKEKGKPQKEVSVREIRKKSASGHQTAVITTNYSLTILKIALLMFARWCQENFFKYMVESFGIDSITSYLKNNIPDTSSVINPAYKALDQEHRKISALLSKVKVKYAEISLENKDLSKKEMEAYIQKKTDKQQQIEDLEKKRQEIIQKKKNMDRKIMFKELDENQKFDTSLNERKFFLDTIKIVAYRAETAMANLIKNQMTSPEQARTLIRRLYQSDADIRVDKDLNFLRVTLHRTNHWTDDKILENLCRQLNQTHTVFPSSNLTLFFNLVSS
jgi:hypothetical protein